MKTINESNVRQVSFLSETTNTILKGCGYIPLPRTDTKIVPLYREIEKYGITLRELNGIFMVRNKNTGDYHLSVKGANQKKNSKYGMKNGLMSVAKILWILRNYRQSQFLAISEIMTSLKIEVHHKNKNCFDNSKTNLTLTTKAKHTRFDCEALWKRYDIPKEMTEENNKCELMIKEALKQQVYNF